MTNRQAAQLRPGARIRRMWPSDDNAVYVVERVEHPATEIKNDTRAIVVHASGHTFRPHEIERADQRPGWPTA